MNHADLILIGVVGLFTLMGFFLGFYRSVSSLLSTLMAAIFTGRAVEFLTPHIGFLMGDSPVGKVIGYAVVFLILSRLIGLVFWLLGKVLGIFSWLPFVKTIDRLLGATLGFVEGVVFAGFAVLYASHVVPVALLAQIAFDQSNFAKYVLGVMKTIELFLPDSVRVFILTTAAQASQLIPPMAS